MKTNMNAKFKQEIDFTGAANATNPKSYTISV